MKRSARDDEISRIRIGRRGLILGGVQLAVAGVLAARMRQLQVEQADEFRLLAEENRVNMRLIAPARGRIIGRNGRLIADNGQNYRVTIVREEAGDVEAVFDALQRIVSIDPLDLEAARREIERRSRFVPVTVAERLTWEELSRVAVNAPALPGITPEVGLSREYPLESDFAHIAGYVGPVSDYDLTEGYLAEDEDPLLQIPRFQVGKTGVEAKREHALRGRAGAKRIEVNASGRVIRELGRDVPVPGADVQLTVDEDLQHFATVRMRDESAAAVVLDVRTGDVLACASAPSFDPNLFTRGISVANYNALTGNEYRPLATKTVQGQYPPGSTFKMLVALAAQQDGLASPGETVYCRGFTELGNRRFHCWKRGGHGYMDLQESIEQSCDVYYYEMAQRVGIDRIAEVARLFGMGEHFDLPLSAVRDGIMPDKAWKRARHGQSWRVGDTYNASIGQGYVLSTPMQLAVMAARLASGRMVAPRLVRAVGDEQLPVPESAPIPLGSEHLQRQREAMYAVCYGARGTARRSRIVGDYRMAGKTGTSQVRNITAEERARGVTRNDQLPWNRRDHALFVGYAPYDDPRYAISVIVEHGGGGSTAAAPVARDIMLNALYGGIPPIEAYPSDQHGRIQAMYDELPLRGTAAAAALAAGIEVSEA
ncbi:peptidoglycan glycosyltransferase [Hasllibacter halocynthiae]|uniref:Peptidoglycan glycosyltransferase n=1 Tax=Hasllibacter halocynthiae TaxID=595589 RepID=A0A2T0X9T1_9RHOB|nr:penicillin-binding protein 2 [Hasllibacter halocynthiae]PRY95702.1 peptidoglycan glycosyltransferase [Hasllibacter halocynthiae]